MNLPSSQMKIGQVPKQKLVKFPNEKICISAIRLFLVIYDCFYKNTRFLVSKGRRRLCGAGGVFEGLK